MNCRMMKLGYVVLACGLGSMTSARGDSTSSSAAVSSSSSAGRSMGSGTEIRAGTEGTGKPYTITVTLRQEYDDNINTSPNNEQGSFKTIVSPGIVFNYPMDNTLVSFSYNFGMTYYWDRPGNDFDFSHLASARLNHKFSERFQLDVRDQFRFAQEAEGRSGSAIQRFLGDGFSNTFVADGTAQWTERFSTITGYGNEIDRYDNSTVGLVNDQITHKVRQDFQLSVLPTTTLVGAYNYETTDYTDGNILTTRDFDRHRVTAGADHYILQNWLLSGRAGAEFVMYEDNGLDDRANPYVDLSTAWTYLPGSSVKGSYNFGTNLTDDAFAGSSLGHTFQLEIKHAITPKLTAGADLRYMIQTLDRSTSLGAANNNEIDENTLNAGLSLNYAINDYLSATAGYTFSMVDTDDALREYWRNQVYIGLTAKY